MREYKVQVSEHMKYVVQAESVQEAKEQVWNEIKDGYTYGWDNKTQFMRSVKATKAD